MKTKILLLTIASIFLSSTIRAQIIHVPADQPTIQAGINAATDGDTVLVAENTYYENIRFMGKAITVTSEYILDSDSSHIVNTIIDGSQAADPDSAATVMFINGEDTTSIINGFTITGGTGVMFMTWVVRAGGGIYSYNAGCKITNNMIIENHIEDDNKAGGAGIGCQKDAGDYWTIIENNTIKNNTSTAHGFSAFGGGIYLSTNGIIKNNRIRYNSCTNTSGMADGGGIELEALPGGSPIVEITGNVIQYNLLEGNTDTYGAGLLCYGVTPEIKNNVISNNTMSAQTIAVGGGIFVNNSPGPVEIANNIIESNSLVAVEKAFGGGIRIVNVSEVVNISDNIIPGNTMDAGISVWGGGIGAYNLGNVNIINNTITYNSGNSNSQQAGGVGVNLLMCGKSFIDHNEINENALSAGTYAWGAGILIDKAKSTVYIQNNSINNNTSEGIGRGGGISIYNDNEAASYDISSNKLISNYSDSWGGGICAKGTYNMYMANNIFMGNESDHSGGAIMFYESSKESGRDDLHPVIANNTFLSNNATNFGGAIYTGYDNEVPVIFNSIFWNNTAGSGADLYSSSTLDMLVYNNDIDTTLIYSQWTGADNILCNPELQSDSIHLDWLSQCVNAGIASLTFGDTTYYCPDQDIDGQDRPFDGTLPDIGADEAQWYYVSVDESISGNTSIETFPNPFSTSTTIEYELQEASTVQITIYNHLSKQVEVINEKNQPKGKHQLAWHGENLPAGVYYCVLKTDNGTKTTKMIKMR